MRAKRGGSWARRGGPSSQACAGHASERERERERERWVRWRGAHKEGEGEGGRVVGHHGVAES
jgi:hypothetical protein